MLKRVRFCATCYIVDVLCSILVTSIPLGRESVALPPWPFESEGRVCVSVQIRTLLSAISTTD